MSFPDRDASPDVGLCQLDDGTLLMPLLVVRDLKRQPRWITSVLLRSSDYGYSWKPLPEPDTDGLSADWWWNTYGKIVQLETGELLWPIARQKKDEDFWRTGLLFSQDRGITWTRYADVARGLADEKYVFPLSRGRLIAHVRDLKTPFLYQAYSTDNGRTWSDCTRTTLYGQCPCLFRTGNGVLLSAHRDMRPGRSGVALAYSFDDGAAWHYGGSLYQPDDQTIRDCSYPTMSALSDGQILCAYYSAYTQGNSDIEAVYLNEA